MTPPQVWVVRPEPGASRTVAAARELGLAARAAPLFVVEPVAWAPPAPAAFDAILFASANALRHAGPALADLAALPAYAVGEATAAAARSAGFVVAATGSGGAQELVPCLARDGRRRVLRLAGAAHVALSPPATMTITTIVVYAARPLPLAGEAIDALRRGGVTLLHSAEAARRLAAECTRAGLERGRVALACLAPRIAQAAGPGWRFVAVAERTDEAALLALAVRMCQTP
ncbi:MAG: uroporphyrinogen-III synthase [Novosphingobium sp.]